MPLLFAPARQQTVDADRINHGTRQDMGADLGPLFQNDDGKLRIDLLQTDGCGQTCRTGTDDHNVEFHAFALGQFHRVGHLIVSSRTRLFCAVFVPNS